MWQLDELRGQVLKYDVPIDHQEIAQLFRYSSVNFWHDLGSKFVPILSFRLDVDN